MGALNEAERAYQRAYRMTNRDKRIAYGRAWRIANADRHRANARAWYAANPDRARATRRAWRVSNKNHMKVLSHAWYIANPERQKANAQAWYVANADRVVAKVRAWRTANPEQQTNIVNARRARKIGNGGSHTLQEWREKCAILGNVCIYCGEAKPLTRDHDIPLVRGGTDNIANILPSCGPCNSRKGMKTAEEFLAVPRRPVGKTHRAA